MITKKDAIAVGKAIVAAATREKENYNNEKEPRWVANGVQFYALDNLWYDVFSNKLKEQFGYDRNKFIDEVLKG
jgi:hypothetical protein